MEPFAQAQNDLFVCLSTRRTIAEAGIDVQVMRPRAALEASAIITKINSALAGIAAPGARAGLAVMVPLPGFENKQPNIPGLFGDMVLTVVVMENILINMGDAGTGVTCEEAATMVMLAGAGFPILDGRGLTCDGMFPLEVDQQDFSADVAYEVRFRCKAGFNAETECAPVQLVEDEGSVTATCSTSGAVIWLTQDGSMPHPDNAAALIVASGSTVIPPATPVVIRARAYHPTTNPGPPAWLRLA